jgi:stearoyl-CoA desaturase (delta-9 desaturase)
VSRTSDVEAAHQHDVRMTPTAAPTRADAPLQTPADPDAAAVLRPEAADMEPMANETLHSYVNLAAALIPFLFLFVVAWQLWDKALHWQDLVIFAVMYIPIGLGVTVGYHRLFTHRSFQTSPTVRFIFGALGSAALEGPVISWVADHRKHHAFSDQEGDPHSPHVDHDGALMSPVKGLVHAHLGWTLLHEQRGSKERYAPDLMKDPTTRFVDRTSVVWLFAGLIVPAVLGFLLTGTLAGAATGFLWGGAVRIFVLHHATFSINSLCHFFGEKRFKTTDESRNLAWLAPLTLGESWHNNHHAFPTSASHGLRWWEFDISALVIRGMEKTGLVWDVVRISPERMAAKAND